MKLRPRGFRRVKARSRTAGRIGRRTVHDRRLTRRRVLRTCAGAAPLIIGMRGASAQAAYPARPVKVVIPYPPAGGADTVGRVLFQKLSEMWGAQFVIDNRGGAGGTIAAAAVAKAE